MTPEVPSPSKLEFFARLHDKIVAKLVEANGRSSLSSSLHSVENNGQPILTHSLRCRGLHLQTTRVFPQLGKLHSYAYREKLHLEREGLRFLRDFLSEFEYRALFDLYERTEQEMMTYEEMKFLNGAKPQRPEAHFQLVSIRYGCSETSAKEMMELGDQVLGEVHEDETLFSFHLGETVPGLQIFERQSCQWVHPDWAQGREVLLGQEVRSLGLSATSHRLRTEEAAPERYSMIMERIGVFPLRPQTDPALIRRLHSATRQRQTAIIIWDKDPGTSDWVKLIQEQVRVHLFYYLRASGQGPFLASQISMADLEGFEFVVVLEPPFALRGEEELNALHSLLSQQPDACFFYFEPHLHRSGISLVNLKTSRLLLERVLQLGAKSLRKEYPNLRWQENRKSLHSRDLDQLSIELLAEEREGLRQHLEAGFSKTFLFNTEPYDEITKLRPEGKIDAILGLASGFKTFFLARNFLLDNPQIYFLDTNQHSLRFWQFTFENWSGEDFPAWVRSGPYQLADFYQIESLDRLWQDELSRWGGALAFQQSWRELQKQPATFHQVDFLALQSFLERNFPRFQRTLFWMSNVWDNEYTSHRLGEQWPSRLRDFWQSLAASPCQWTLLGSPIYWRGKAVDILNKSPHQILQELDQVELPI